ncbi:hypothetical protein ZWY2020_010467 [Hordeum vulgare]|nr:hypothetical protein ZWY2020_010467 [Hordeum vulgare]
MDSFTNSELKHVVEREEAAQEKPCRERGGWFTIPFIAGTYRPSLSHTHVRICVSPHSLHCVHEQEHAGLGLAVHGTTSNLLVYRLKECNVESIDVAQIANVVPVPGAVLADSYLGCFPVILAGSVINLLHGSKSSFN